MTLEVMSNVFEGLQSIAKQLHIEKKLQIAKDCKLAVKDFFKSCLSQILKHFCDDCGYFLI